MTQERSLPTQKELDTFIFEAKMLRQKTIVALFKRLFHMPLGLKRRVEPTIKANLGSIQVVDASNQEPSQPKAAP